MSTGLRVVVASSGSEEFGVLHSALTGRGHVPVAYLVSLSLKPGDAPDPYILDKTRDLMDRLPAGMDLLLPGAPGSLLSMLSGYAPDVLLVSGFNWKFPDDVLRLPKLAALNIHPAPLPKYRGPSPVLHAIRNGDTHLGLTIHRMTSRFDAGPVLARVTDIPMPETPTRDSVRRRQEDALPALIATALDRAAAGDPGTPQDETAATSAGFPPEEWMTVTWRSTRRDTYDQLRFLCYVKDEPPKVRYGGRELHAERFSLTDDGSVPVACSDGPLWVTFSPAR